MNGSTPYQNRKLLPRWRTLSQTVDHGELKYARKSANKPVNFNSSSLLSDLVARWQKERNIENAAELISSGVVVGVNNEVENAANFLIESSNQVAPAIIRASNMVLNGNVVSPVEDSSLFSNLGDINSIYRKISKLKTRVRKAPRDAISWIELARLYTLLGQNEPASKCIQMAVDLAPENRFVLRAASRFFANSGDSDEGLFLLRKSNSINRDPWLQATEISLSDIGGVSSKYLKFAIDQIMKDVWEPRHSAELCGAAATVLYADGRNSKARKLMKLSIRDPNENSFTQAEWASIKGWAPSISDELFQIELAPEALTLRERHALNWERAISACINWSEMEPTSSMPLTFGAFISLVALENGHKALTFLERAAVRIPNDPMVINNQAVAYAYIGDIEKATTSLNQLNSMQLPKDRKAVQVATNGLIEYRRGEFSKGRDLYIDAIRISDELKDDSTKFLAIWHLLREESKLGTPKIEEIVKYVDKIYRRINIFPEIEGLKEKIELDLKSSRKRYNSNELTSPWEPNFLPYM